MKPKIFIASDHGGFELKEKIKKHIKGSKLDFVDLGIDSAESTDYPIYAKILCNEILKNPDSKGILICGTGIGMSMAANRFKGIRAALCHDDYTAKMSREHNDSNVLCLGGRVLDDENAIKLVNVWLNTDFSGEERHKKRINQI
jgi:ribose 5-phosphate isomerase B